MESPKKIVILGAGPSGLAAAWSLVRDGHHVLVLEKENVCGGQCITFARGGFRYDLGPHNIHSKHRVVLDFLKQKLGQELRSNEFFAQIYFRGKRIDYPFEGLDVLKAVRPWTGAWCALSFFGNRFFSIFNPRVRDDGTYETWIVNRFGRRFFDIFFGPYSEKVWGIPTRELSDLVAKRRIPVRGFFELIRLVIFREQRFHPENPKTVKSFYPRLGIGEVAKCFVREIEQGGGIIKNGAEVKQLVVESGCVKEVSYSWRDRNERIVSQGLGETNNLYVLSTIPVNKLVGMTVGEIPPEVADAAKGMDFTAEVFLYLDLNCADAFKVPVFYFSDSEFPFNRIYDIGQFSRDMVPEGKTALCLEVSCTVGDEVWNIDDQTLFEMCLKPLERHKLLFRSQVDGFHTRRLSHAYPRFRVEYEENLRKIFDYLDFLSNIWSFGRQGLFSYANIDDAIWMGFQVATNLPLRQKIGLTTMDLFPDV